MISYENVIQKALADGGLLDALLALQNAEGYVSEDALNALAEYAKVSPAELYDAASFYSMLRFAPPAKTEIRICRGTACHSADNADVVTALEAETGLKMGESNESCSLGWVGVLLVLLLVVIQPPQKELQAGNPPPYQQDCRIRSDYNRSGPDSNRID